MASDAQQIFNDVPGSRPRWAEAML